MSRQQRGLHQEAWTVEDVRWTARLSLLLQLLTRNGKNFHWDCLKTHLQIREKKKKTEKIEKYKNAKAVNETWALNKHTWAWSNTHVGWVWAESRCAYRNITPSNLFLFLSPSDSNSHFFILSSFCLFTTQKFRCKHHDPCALFTTRKRKKVEEVSTNPLCECDPGYTCPAKHRHPAVLSLPSNPFDNTRPYSAYCYRESPGGSFLQPKLDILWSKAEVEQMQQQQQSNNNNNILSVVNSR